MSCPTSTPAPPAPKTAPMAAPPTVVSSPPVSAPPPTSPTPVSAPPPATSPQISAPPLATPPPATPPPTVTPPSPLASPPAVVPAAAPSKKPKSPALSPEGLSRPAPPTSSPAPPTSSPAPSVATSSSSTTALDRGQYQGSGSEGKDLDFSRLNKGKGKMHEGKVSYVTTYDLREVLGGLRVVDQGREENCWAIVVATAIAIAYHHRYGGQVKDLAVQELLDRCNPDMMVNYKNTLSNAFEYAKVNGICLKDSYKIPYNGAKNPGTVKTEEERQNSLFISGTYVITPEDEEGLEMALRTTGGVAGGIRVTEDFRHLGDDIWEALYLPAPTIATNKPDISFYHAILIVGIGYSVPENKEYWTIMNTWGELWGTDGYGKVLRGRSLIFGVECPYFV